MGDDTQTRSLAYAGDVSPADRRRIGEVLPELELIESEADRETVASIWAHAWRCSDWDDPSDAFMTISRLPEGHDPYKERWNQVEHTRAVVALAEAMLPTFERHVGAVVDRQTMLVAILLHDVAKLVEFSPGGADGPVETPLGEVLHHATIGAQWAVEAGFSPAVAHAIVAHSPSTSATPQTPEALVLKLADQVVTDVNRMTTGIETTP
jgi:putative nucleotidyltransferase with HDIG domain